MTNDLTRISRRRTRRSNISMSRKGVCWRRVLAFCLAAALLHVFSLHAPSRAAVVERTRLYGEMIAAGVVKVDGLKAISGQTVFSGNSISTASNSIATVIIGKLARFQLLSDSSARLSFEANILTATLNAGKMRFSLAAGVSLKATTRDATLIADDTQATIFSISVDDKQTIVTTESGRVSLHAAGKAQQVNAGQVATADRAALSLNASQPPSRASQNFSGGEVAALLLAVGGLIATAVIVVTDDGREREVPFEEEGCVTILSGPFEGCP